MKRVSFILTAIIMDVVMLSACSGATEDDGASKDERETKNNLKKEVTIGKQIWMTKNLDVTTFRNGDSIPAAKTNEEWVKAGKNKQPVWCYFDNNLKNAAKYGKLYNWYAVSDPRGLAPKGYRVASDADWVELENYLDSDVGIKMKSTDGWFQKRESFIFKYLFSRHRRKATGTNSSGFTGLPGGLRMNFGTFDLKSKYGFWWCSSEIDSSKANCRTLCYEFGALVRYFFNKGEGLSVRCLRD